MCFILGNIIAMCLEEDDQNPSDLAVITTAYQVFSYVFILEALFKIFILGFCTYIHNAWNK